MTLEQLRKEQKLGSSPKDLDQYVGTYWGDIHVIKIVVSSEGGALYWAFQGLDSEKYQLDHYHDDVFTWLRTRDELAKRGRWIDQGPPFWKVEFGVDGDDQIVRLSWVHDIGVPAEEFRKVAEGDAA